MLRPMRSTRKKPLRAAVNKGTAGLRVSDEWWAVLEPVLPSHRNPQRFGGGKPRTPEREGAEAIFSVLRTGCQWGAWDTDRVVSPFHGACAVSRMGGRRGIAKVVESRGGTV